MRRPLCVVGVTALVLALSSSLSAQWPKYPTPGVPRTANGATDSGRSDAKDGGRQARPVRYLDAFAGPGGGAAGTPVPAPPGTPPIATFFDVGAGFPEGLPFQPWAAELKKTAQRREQQRQSRRALPADGLHAVPHASTAQKDHPDTRTDHDHLRGQLRPSVHLHGRPAAPAAMVNRSRGGTATRSGGGTAIRWSWRRTTSRTTGGLTCEAARSPNRRESPRRFHRVNFGKLEIDITIDDPKAYTKPFTVRVNQQIMVDTEMIEFICNENNQFLEYLERNQGR